jgi:tRNA A37 threonylcarbamoyladenosine dehydratase
MERYLRTELLFGKEKLDKIKNATVAICGLGAVGSFALESLVRTGVGNIIVVDFDVVGESNINRQILALESTIGLQKTDVAEQRIKDINPNCNVTKLHFFIDHTTVQQVLDLKPDAIIDAIDSLTPKCTLLEQCVLQNQYVISSMGAARRTDPTKIKVGDISKTEHCPLARFVRRRLRRRGIEKGVSCVFSTEEAPKQPDLRGDGTGLSEDAEELFRGHGRVQMGSFSCITGIFGLVAAKEAIFHIIGR